MGESRSMVTVVFSISGHFQMPYSIVRDGIEKSLKEKCRQLKRYIQKIEKQKGK